MDQPKCAECRKLKDQLEEALIQQDKLLIRKNEYESTIKQLSSQMRSIQKELAENREDLKQAHAELAKINFMKEEQISWSKKIITLGEMYQKTKEQLDALNSNHFVKVNSKDSLLMRLETCKRDLDKEKSLVDSRTRERDWFRGRLAESEQALNCSKQACNDVQRRMQEQKQDFRTLLHCKQQRIESLEKINDALTQKVQLMNRQMGKEVVDLPNMDSLHFEPEPDLGEIDDVFDLPSHTNHHI